MRTSNTAPPPTSGNLAVAPDRQDQVNEVVVATMACWMHAHQADATISQVRSHVCDLKKQVIAVAPTEAELRIAKSHLKEIGFRINIGAVRFLVAALLEADEPEQHDGDETHRDVKAQFANLVRFPELRPQATLHDPLGYEGETDEQTGEAGKAFCECTGADALCICARPPAGMTGGKSNIPRDERGRFTKRS